ncbi:hypothetical protein GGR55DRAFT_661800 [Xylaria sp. FL0064]|nr:hypothetical protein GGR55DRAFT_661800 [Xylaria sp. FL0064]
MVLLVLHIALSRLHKLRHMARLTCWHLPTLLSFANRVLAILMFDYNVERSWTCRNTCRRASGETLARTRIAPSR